MNLVDWNVAFSGSLDNLDIRGKIKGNEYIFILNVAVDFLRNQNNRTIYLPIFLF